MKGILFILILIISKIEDKQYTSNMLLLGGKTRTRLVNCIKLAMQFEKIQPKSSNPYCFSKCLQKAILKFIIHFRLSILLFSAYLSLCLSVFLSFCLSVFLSLCLSISLFLCLSVSLSPCLSVSLSFCLSVFLSLCLSVFLSLCLSVSLFLCLSISLSPCLSVSLSLCLSVSPTLRLYNCIKKLKLLVNALYYN
jgi:hypothetical protein